MATGMLKIESVTELDSEWMPTCLPFVPWYMHQGLNWAFRAWQIVDCSLQPDWLAANSTIVRQRFRFMQAEGGSEADVTMGGNVYDLREISVHDILGCCRRFFTPVT